MLLRGDDAGAGTAVVALHGLTATRRYVLHGSRLLERRGYRVVAYDARGHGESSPAPERTSYGYENQVRDLLAVLDGTRLERVVLVGNSMGAGTAMALALRHPERVSALVQVTPAYAGARSGDLEGWNALADGLEHGGVDGFLEAYRPAVGELWREAVLTFTRRRLERHRDLEAVTDALRVVPRSRPFESLAELRALDVPVLVIGSRDDSDPGHPLAVAEAYAEALPRAELVVEDPGRPPLAWRGVQVSRAVAAFLEREGL